MVNKPFEYTRLPIREDSLRDDLSSIAFGMARPCWTKYTTAPKSLSRWCWAFEARYQVWVFELKAERCAEKKPQWLSRNGKISEFKMIYRGCETGVLHVYVVASEALVEKYILWFFVNVPRFSFATSYTWDDRVKNAESTCRNVSVFTSAVYLLRWWHYMLLVQQIYVPGPQFNVLLFSPRIWRKLLWRTGT